MSAGYAYRCDQCGTTTIPTEDKLLRPAPTPEGWLSVYEERGKDRVGTRTDFCSRQCLLGWIWDESK